MTARIHQAKVARKRARSRVVANRERRAKNWPRLAHQPVCVHLTVAEARRCRVSKATP